MMQNYRYYTMKEILFGVLFLCCNVAQAGTIDSLYHHVRKSSHIDVSSVNHLFVALDAEGITDSLISISRHASDDETRKQVSYYMGLYYNSIYKYAYAADAFSEASRLARQTSDLSLEAECLSAAAVQYHKMGDFKRSIASCIEALRIDSVLQDTVALSCDLNILSGSSLSAGRTDEAVRYIMKAIEWEKKRSNPASLSIRYGSAAEILNKAGDTEEALRYANMAYELDRQAKNPIGVARRMSQMADIYTARKEYATAERYYQRAIDTLEVYKEFHSLTIDLRLLGNVLQMQGRHTEAIPHYLRSQELARNTGNRFFLALASRGLAKSYQAIGKYAEAATCWEQAFLLTDSLNTEKQEGMARDFRMQFELQEAQNEVMRRQNLVRMQQISIAVLLFFLAVLVVSLLILHFRKRGKATDIENADSFENDAENTTSDSTSVKLLSSDDRQFLVAVSEFVHNNMKTRKITIDLLAQEMCMSRSQFIRRMSGVAGEQPNAYFTRIKMEKAVRLLKSTNMSIKEVAYDCGFDESNYFIHVFRQFYGTTPQQFRQTPKLMPLGDKTAPQA